MKLMFYSIQFNDDYQTWGVYHLPQRNFVLVFLNYSQISWTVPELLDIFFKNFSKFVNTIYEPLKNYIKKT
jgi:hypothetical protein